MMPPLDLLTESQARKTIDISVVEDMRQQIIDGFKKNKVEVSELSVIAGPTVVRFEFTSNQSYKIKQIRSCENTLNEVLSEYGPIRIIAPVSGKGTFAVEVPRPDRQIVRLREVLESDEFQKSKAKLPIALGIPSENKPLVADLARMPHLLIAGMTGQGKSVLLNNIILSLLYKKSPEDLKLTLIDTKMVEFSQYDQIARQYFIDFAGIGQKVITDVHEALTVLNAIVVEMDERYNLFRCAQCRNLEEYNRLILDGKLSEQDGHHLPYIIVCIDEFADLTMPLGKDAEIVIARIAQKARGVGIHVIIATQCTSANVITGVIKANFPERIALRVKHMDDSRTILDCPGGERLIGRGDMLFYSSYYGPLTRIQCCFVDTEEIENVSDWETNCEPPQPYKLPVISIIEQKPMMGDSDPLFEEAARYIIECGMASTSKLQRRFSIGYYHANRLMDQLEADGIVGPKNGVKPREILKKGDSNDKHESSKSLFKRLLNLLNSDNDDDFKEELPEKAEKQIVPDKERDKVDVPICEDFIDDLSIPQYKFPYEDYRIIGYEVNSTADKLWTKCLKQISEKIKSTEFERLFAHTRVADFNNNDLTISVPSQWYYDQIEKRYMPIIAPILKQVFGGDVKLFYCFENYNNSTKFSIDAIDQIIQTCGHINIDVADIASTLSTDTLNYVTVGFGNSITDAVEQSVDNLPINSDQVGKILFQILIPKDYKPDMSAIKSMTDFIGKYNQDIDVCWGLAFDESLTDSIKVILIASSK